MVEKGKTTDNVEHYTTIYMRQTNGLWRVVAMQSGAIK